MTRARSGFTVAEVIVAIILLSVGLLAMSGTSAMTSRTLNKSRRVDFAAVFAGRRLEMLRSTACASRASGADTLLRGSAIQAINNWSFVDAGNSTYRIYLTTTYMTGTGIRGTGTLKMDVLRTESGVTCLI